MEKSFKAEEAVTKQVSGEGDIENGGLNNPNHVELHRALKARHITMIGRCNFDVEASMR
jgi:amino acid transporter